jgi:ATP-binding cassette subfamily C (CFTR/MRP) protein 1
MKVKDERIKMTSEVMSSIKAIKMSGWEEAFCAQVKETRDRELTIMKSYIYLRAVSRTVWTAAPVLVTLTTFATFVLTGGVLDPATAFTSLTLLNILQFPLAVLPNIFNSAIEAGVSLRRLALFFQAAELDQSKFLTRLSSDDAGNDTDGTSGRYVTTHE